MWELHWGDGTSYVQEIWKRNGEIAFLFWWERILDCILPFLVLKKKKKQLARGMTKVFFFFFQNYSNFVFHSKCILPSGSKIIWPYSLLIGRKVTSFRTSQKPELFQVTNIYWIIIYVYRNQACRSQIRREGKARGHDPRRIRHSQNCSSLWMHQICRSIT